VRWVLRGFASYGAPPIAVPALLTRAYHGRVDVPGVLEAAGVAAHLTPVLGPSAPGEQPSPLLISALRRRLAGVDVPFDGVVFASAGTSDAAARSTVEHTAAVLSAALGVPCVAAYASASRPTGSDAVAALRRMGATRPAVSSYFFATGRLHRAVVRSAVEAGAVAVAEPLADAPELVELILSRAREAVSTR
jgi:sirohydrochlorin ferrochelatase